MATSGLYIHIPFCENKCLYCNFFSAVNMNDYEVFERYLNAVILEYDIRIKDFNTKIDTVYIGGGTPSIIGYKLLDSFLERLFKRLSDIKEITIEFNVNHVEENILKVISGLKNARVSLGVQTFDEHILETIKRKTKKEDILHAIKLIDNSLVDNISLDFICALPLSLADTTAKDISYAFNILPKIKHISLYYLETSNALYNKWKDILPHEETAIKAYENAIEVLRSFDIKRYEVSNFSLNSDYASKHNMHYWKLDDYLALGASAFGCYENIRYENTKNIKNYMSYIENSDIEKATATKEYLDKMTRKKEFIFLSLRTIQGINLKEYERIFEERFLGIYQNIILQYKKYFNITEEYVCVYEEYFNYIDEISLLFF